ncbi:MAG: hypothetical protein IKP66_03255 [Lachnospiraceae bacterium]|nr:hypothetical protein [Lachnospiraceae bacterium]
MEKGTNCPICTHKLFVPEKKNIELVVKSEVKPGMNVVGYIKCKHCGNQVAIVEQVSKVAA